MYSFGRGVSQDEEQAAKWYRRAAAQGHARAQFMLGEMYARGVGVPWDYNQEVKWLRMAAEQGFAAAQLRLARLYARGRGTPEDHVRAYAWLNLATGQCGLTGRKAGRIKDTLGKQMTVEQLAQAETLSNELRERVKASKSR